MPPDFCLACGVCCNGVLFKDVELQSCDDAPGLERLGLPLSRPKRRASSDKGSRPAARPKIPQPCAALSADGRCRVYETRPVRCREFECVLFKSLRDGKTDAAAAQRILKTVRQRAEKVRRLLRELGDANEHLALSLRFRRVRKRLETGFADDADADLYGRLTIAVHELNLLLRDAFYPGNEEG